MEYGKWKFNDADCVCVCVVFHLPGPINSIINVNGIITQNARMNKHPRRRRGDAVSPIFIFKYLEHLQINLNKT